MEEIKDLGGLVNKDIAFNKLPENVVYDSQNFRVVTTEGASSGARENVKGTVLLNSAPSPVECTQLLTFNPNLDSELVVGKEYYMSFTFFPNIPIRFPGPSQRDHFIFTNLTTLINDLHAFLASDAALANAGYGFNIIGSNVISLTGPNCGFKQATICDWVDPNPPPPPTPPPPSQEFIKPADGDFTGVDPSLAEGLPKNSFWIWSVYHSFANYSTATDLNLVVQDNWLGYTTHVRALMHLPNDPDDGLLNTSLYSNNISTSEVEPFADPTSTSFFVPGPPPPTQLNDSSGNFVASHSFFVVSVRTPSPYHSPPHFTQPTCCNIGSCVPSNLCPPAGQAQFVRSVMSGQSIGSVTPLPNGAFNAPGIAINSLSHPFATLSYGPFQARLNYYVKIAPQSKVTITVYVDLGLAPKAPYENLFESMIPDASRCPTCSTVSFKDSYGNSFNNSVITETGSDLLEKRYLKIGSVDHINNTGSWADVDKLNTSDTVYLNCVTLYNNNITNLGDILEPNTGARTARWDYLIALDVEASDPNDSNLFNTLKGAEFYFKKFDFWKDLSLTPINLPPVRCYPNLTSISTLNSGGTAGRIVGWTALRDDIYIFTTNGFFNPSSSPGPFNSIGQIWKLSYNKAGDYSDPATYAPLDLIYSGNLNLTIYRPIANPGMIESRYENSKIQKIYWTDNFNVPRQINVADSNARFLTPDQLALQPALSMDLPMVTEVLDGGGLLVGVYQVAYRLKNINGAESRFSRTSNSIPIIDAPEANATVENYFPRVPVGQNANKSIRVRVDNIDTNYNLIEFVTLYYFDEKGDPDIYIVKEAFVPPSGTIEIIISGEEVKVPITVNEFTSFNTVVKRCKTLAATKQTLFLGNITTTSQDIDFDARAYRFPHPGGAANGTITYVEDTPGVYVAVTYDPTNNSFLYGTTGLPVPEDANCIQSYVNQNPYDPPNPNGTYNSYLYQPGTDILGGQGPNVKYEFVTTSIELDTKSPSGQGPVGAPFTDFGGQSGGPHYVTSVNPSVTFPPIIPSTATINTTSYSSKRSSRSDYGSPYNYDMYKGYRRDEMYRFGIVFFDELDNPTYVKWIGDIRMPHIYMPDNAKSSTSQAKFPGTGTMRSRIMPAFPPEVSPNSFASDPIYWQRREINTSSPYAAKLYARPLGIKFTINFSSVPTKYKRAAIVRVPLEENYKHIYGQGLMLPTFQSKGIPTTGPNSGPYDDNNAVFLSYGTNGGNWWYDNYLGGGDWNNLVYDCWTFRCPEYLFKRNFSYQGGDSVEIVNILHPNSVDVKLGAGGAANTEARNISGDRTYLQVEDAQGNFRAARTSYNPAANPPNNARVDYNPPPPAVGDKKYLVAWKTKYYTAVEFRSSFLSTWWPSPYAVPAPTANVPVTMTTAPGTGRYSYKGPYSVIATLDISAGGPTRDYTKGSITGNSSTTLSPPRTVHGCTPRNLNVLNSLNAGLAYPVNLPAPPAPFFGYANETQYVHSYTNDCLFIQLNDGQAKNFAEETDPNGARFTKFDTLESMAPFHEFVNAPGGPGAFWGYLKKTPSFGQYLVNYKRTVVNPFGGQDYFSRASSEYILCNNLIDISTKGNAVQTIVYGGDTAISVLDHVIQFPDRLEAQNTGGVAPNDKVFMGYHVASIPVETNVAIEFRRSFNNTNVLDSTSAVPNRVKSLKYHLSSTDSRWEDPNELRIEAYEYFNIDPVFNHDPKSVYKFFPKPPLIDPSEDFDCRVLKSETKTDGELTESWSVFKADAKLDVESAYGPINNLVVFQNKLYYFQDRAFGVLQVNEQKLISDSVNSADLILGSSGILERYDYISTKTGTKHQFSMHASDYSLIWFDTLARKVYRYRPEALEPITDIKGYNALIYNKTAGNLQSSDNPYVFAGIHATYDYRYNEFYITFLNRQPYPNQPLYVDLRYNDTLVYNELLDGFTGSYTHYPKIYINDKLNIFGVMPNTGGANPIDGIHVHNYGPYGKFYSNLAVPSKISFVVNSNPVIEKTFTNLELIAETYGRQNYGHYDTIYKDHYIEEDPVGFNPGPSTRRMNYQYAPLITNLFYDIANNSSLRFYNTYQNTDWVPMNRIGRKHKTIWNIKVPSDMVIGQDPTLSIFNQSNLLLPIRRPKFTRRLKDKWFVVDFSYDNASDHRLVVHSAKAIYTPNSR